MNPKEVALAHFEKAILGVCLAVMVWYLYSMLSIKPYARKPEEFTDATQKAKTYVTDPKRTLPETEAKELTAINFVEQATRLFKEYAPDDVKDYIHLQRWVRPFDYGVNFRNEPKILAPSKPWLQPNRGLMQTYLFDAAGNIKKQKVPKSQAKGGRKGIGEMAGGVRGGKHGGGGRSGMPGGAGDDQSGASSGMQGAGAGGGMINDDQSGASMGMGMMGRGPGGPGRGGIGDDLGGMEGSEGPGSGNAKFGGAHNKNKIIERMASKNSKKDKEKKKDEEEVEEPIESREGYRWVEICAAFPHSQQIVEYVKALREKARDVKLEYAMVDVERQELTPNFTWSEFKAIPIKEQFDYVSSALAMESEGSRALVPGLAMNIPVMDVQQREYLHLDKDKFPFYAQPEKAEYTLEELDPVGAERQREAEEARKKRENPNYKRSPKKKTDTEKKYLPDRGGGADLGFNDPNKRKDDKAGKTNNHVALKTALIRYWDFTVEPGRRYKYRIRVKVFNPNYKRTDVADPDMASRILLTGPWSDTSDEVFVDFDNHWYVAEQKRSSQKSNEMMLEVHYWYRGMGEWLVSNFAQRVGQFVGLPDRAKTIKVLDWNDVTHDYEPRDLKMERFDSGNLLVGLSQGNATFDLGSLGAERGVAVPREAVALNPFGDLVRHDEQADKTDDVRISVNENFSTISKAITEMTGEGKKEEKEDKPGKKKGGGRGGAGGAGGTSGA